MQDKNRVFAMINENPKHFHVPSFLKNFMVNLFAFGLIYDAIR